MDWVLLFLVQVMSWPSLSALFTVEADRRSYEAEFGGTIIMGCHFRPLPSKSNPGPKVIWHRVIPGPSVEVFQLDDGVEKLASQDPAYRGRVSMLPEELDQGSAKLQVTSLRINDSGTYRCLMQMGGADYKLFTLSVKAPYKEVVKSTRESADGHEVALTCQSEGYPLAVVTWRDGEHREVTSSRPTTETTSDQLVRVISQITVSSSYRNNYTCTFADEGPSATFYIPDVIPTPSPAKGSDPLIMSCVCVILAVIAVVGGMLLYRRQKALRDNGARSSNNILVDIERDPTDDATACLQIRDHGNEEKLCTYTQAPRDCVETLREVLKAHYAGLSTNRRETQCWNSLCQKELPGRLQNSVGQPVDLHILLRESKETLLLEGAAGSGKSTVVQTLASSWAVGSDDGSSSLPGCSSVHLLLLLDCSKAMCSLFQEITTQLSLKAIATENVLKTLLTGTTEALLLLDGYTEGNQVFDESLVRFLKEKQGCRVLVTACPEHCPKLKERVGTRGQLTLQSQATLT